MVCDCNALDASIDDMDDNVAVSILTATHCGALLHTIIGKVGLILTDGIVLKYRSPLDDKRSTLEKEARFE